MEQAGAIPYQIKNGKVRYLIITSSSGRWIFPKGMIDPGDSAKETAYNESYEEAGIIGKVGAKIGSYSYQKWNRSFEVSMYLLLFQRPADVWLEKSHRERRWLAYDEAHGLLSKNSLRDLLKKAHQQILQSLKEP
jgi:8-oxo-dGTP pyrophosphatase MutT (NUDIX family)